MGNTKEGGKKVRETLLRKYGKDYYSRISGGKYKGPKGFAVLGSEAAREAGRKGKRKKNVEETK